MRRKRRSFFSTNRVCSRCLALKDTIVGYTDEVGVTIPPLHPRCRCAIIYDEVAEPRVNKTSQRIPSSNTTSTGLVSRTLEEAKAIADKLNPIVGAYFARKSKWSGKVVVSPRESNCKLPNCHIGILLQDCPDEAILHELVHAHSTSYYTLNTYQMHSAIEEASVQYLTQEIAKLEGIALEGSDYDFWADVLREINRKFGLYESDLKFARQLLRVPMPIREEWLWSKIRKSVETVEQMTTATMLMNNLTREALEKWIREN